MPAPTTTRPLPDRRRPDRPPRRVTREQRRTLQTIAGLMLLRGDPPALGELAATLGISKPSAFERLHWMAKKGLLDPRSRAITPSGLEEVLAQLRALMAPANEIEPASR